MKKTNMKIGLLTPPNTHCVHYMGKIKGFLIAFHNAFSSEEVIKK